MLQVVGCAIERIDDPGASARSGLAGSLFAKDCVARKLTMQIRHDRGLALAVGARDPVVARLDVGVVFAEALPIFEEDFRSELRCLNGGLDVLHAASIQCAHITS